VDNRQIEACLQQNPEERIGRLSQKALGGFTLHHEIRIGWDGRVIGQLRDDRVGGVERNVREHLVRRPRRAEAEKIRLVNRDVRRVHESLPEKRGKVGILLHRDDAPTAPSQSGGNNPTARTDLQHKVIQCDAGPIEKSSDQSRITEEILRVLEATTRESFHVTAPLRNLGAKNRTTLR